jgi:catechol 2,3-dioxygenase-like lactoylglutathione lyase family enzyme
MTPKLTHIALRVKNIEASAAFYQKYACLEIVAQREENGTRVVWLGNSAVKDHFVIVLLEMDYSPCVQPSYDHFGLDVHSKEEVDRMAAMAKEEGCLSFGPETLGPVAGYLCLVCDPDGNQIEFSFNQEIDSALHGKRCC